MDAENGLFLNSDTMQQRLIASVAHELKSPLTLISGLSAQLQKPGINPEQYQRYVQRIQYSSDRLLGLVDSILRGYELEQQQLELRLEPICPQLLLEEVAHELMPHARKQAQIIAVGSSRQKRIVLADRGCLHAVIFNLLDNAIKYSDPEATIELESRLRSGRPQIVVKDCGVGFKKADLKKLFSQFGAKGKPVPGWATTTGLGLYVANQLTDAMGGKLSLTRHKKGSSFLVTLQQSRQLNLFEV